jgi:hypothetical protein
MGRDALMCNCKPPCVRHILTDEEMKKIWERIDKKKLDNRQ